MENVGTFTIGLDTPIHLLTPRQLFEMLGEWQAKTKQVEEKPQKPERWYANSIGELAEIHDNESLKKVNPDYFYQCQNHMACTNTSFCDFIAFCPFVENPIHIVRITRDNDEIALIEERVALAEDVIKANYPQLNPQRA